MKYKVGDKVKIREDLEIDRRYNKCLFIEDMEKYKGKIATITRVTTTRHDNFGKISDYDIDIDDGDWCWTDDMFEEVGDIEKEADNDFTVENVLNHTDIESGGMIIEVFYPTASFKATIGYNRIVRNSELYKRFIMAYGDMIVDEINILCDEHGDKHMRLVVDYKDEE